MDWRFVAWIAAVALIGVAVASGFADHRRVRRTDPDAVGPISWPTVQVLSLIGAAIVVSVALNL